VNESTQAHVSDESLVNICAYGIGSPLIGKLNDLLGVSTNPGLMRYSLLVCPIGCALSALMLWRGSRVLTESDEKLKLASRALT
jgi:hypothetical protein